VTDNLIGSTDPTITKDTATFTFMNAATTTISTLSLHDALPISGGTTSFTFTVTKTGATTQSATVGFTTVDGTATGNSSCATAATGTPDYISNASTHACTPSTTTKTITAPACTDTTLELTETFTVNLSGHTGATHK